MNYSGKYESPDAEILQCEICWMLCDSVLLGNEGFDKENEGGW